MDDQKVLIDRVQVILIEGLHQVDVSVKVLNRKLLVRIFILLHKDAILNLLIPLRLLKVPREDHCTHQQDEVLQCHKQE